MGIISLVRGRRGLTEKEIAGLKKAEFLARRKKDIQDEQIATIKDINRFLKELSNYFRRLVFSGFVKWKPGWKKPRRFISGEIQDLIEPLKNSIKKPVNVEKRIVELIITGWERIKIYIKELRLHNHVIHREIDELQRKIELIDRLFNSLMEDIKREEELDVAGSMTVGTVQRQIAVEEGNLARR